MNSLTKWMLAAAMAIGGLGLSATPAKAAQVGFYIGTNPAYAPAYPGPGYTWIAGYYANGYWIPGRWAFVGYGNQYYNGDRDDYYRDRDDHYRDRDDRDRGRNDFYRGNDRDRGRNYDRDNGRRGGDDGHRR